MKIRFVVSGLSLGAVSLVAASGCGGDSQEPRMAPASQVLSAATPAEAVDAIARARCDREQRCGNIGPSSEYQSSEHCMNVAKSDASEELAEDEDCRRGIKPEDLNECVSHLSQRSCGPVGGTFDRLSGILSCRSAELCMD